MSWTRSLTLSLFALLTIPSLTSAQSFEGVLKERSVEMSEEGLFDLLWSGDEDELRFAPAVRALNRTQEVNGLQASGFEAEVGAEVGRGWCAQDVTGIRAAMEELAEQADQFGDTDEEHEGETVEDLLCKDQLPVLVKVLRSDVFGGGFRFTINEVQDGEKRGGPGALPDSRRVR